MDTSKIKFIKELLTVEPDLAKQLLQLSQYKEYAMGTSLNSVGFIDNRGMFLLEGVCKYSIKGRNGQEIIFIFMNAPAFIPYSPYGFFLNKESRIICTTATEIKGYQISSTDLLPIVEKHTAELFPFYVTELLKIFTIMQTKEIQIIEKTSKERYQEFIKSFPGIIDRIPLKDVASYLNIHPSSLSRIRKQLKS